MDTQDPTITCPANVTNVPADAGQCYATGVALGSPTTEDNCGVATVTSNAPAQFPVGTTTVTWTVTDIHGRTATCNQSVAVVDTQDPTITGTLTTSNVEGCSVSAAPAAAATVGQLEALAGSIRISDACTSDALLLVSHSDASNGSCPIVIARTYTITDAYTNSVQIVHTINIRDVSAPSLINPAVACSSLNRTGIDSCLSTAQEFDPRTLNGAVASLYADNCSAPTATWTSTTSGASNSNCSWTFTYLYSISDVCGNTTICSVTYAGGDKTPPVITNCPVSRLEVETANDIPEPTTVNFTDCSGDGSIDPYSSNNFLEVPYGLLNKPGYCPDSLYRYYIATDACGNRDTCLQVIVITNPSVCQMCQETVNIMQLI